LNYKIGINNSITEYKNSVFETFLIEDGHPYFLDAHLNRLKKACKVKLDIEINIKSIASFINDNIPIEGKSGGRLVCNFDSCILSFRDVEYKGSSFLEIASVIRDSKDEKYFYKTNDYFERLEELKKARELSFIDSIYLNEKGFVTSCSIANIYFFKAGVIYTPSIDNGLLNGIIRSIILESNNCKEGNFTIKDFIESDGIFISNSLLEIFRIDGIIDQKVIFDELTFKKIRNSYFREKNIDRRKNFG